MYLLIITTIWNLVKIFNRTENIFPPNSPAGETWKAKVHTQKEGTRHPILYLKFKKKEGKI